MEAMGRSWMDDMENDVILSDMNKSCYSYKWMDDFHLKIALLQLSESLIIFVDSQLTKFVREAMILSTDSQLIGQVSNHSKIILKIFSNPHVNKYIFVELCSNQEISYELCHSLFGLFSKTIKICLMDSIIRSLYIGSWTRGQLFHLTNTSITLYAKDINSFSTQLGIGNIVKGFSSVIVETCNVRKLEVVLFISLRDNVMDSISAHAFNLCPKYLGMKFSFDEKVLSNQKTSNTHAIDPFLQSTEIMYS